MDKLIVISKAFLNQTFMKKHTLETSVILALIIILFLTYGCGGTRNTNKERHEISSNHSFNDSSYILTQNFRLNNIGEIVPIDNTKPFFVDGKEYFNVSIRFDKSKFEGFELNKKEIGTVTGTSEITDNKQTEKKDNTSLYLGIVLIFGCLFFAWFYFKGINPFKL